MEQIVPSIRGRGPYLGGGGGRRGSEVFRTVLSFETSFLVDAQDVVERAGEGDEGGAPVLGRGREARKTSLRKRLASTMSVMPASLSSWGRRFCKVPNMRSERPLASGE